MRRFVSHVVFLSLKENLSSLPNNKLIINENLSDSRYWVETERIYNVSKITMKNQ